MNFIYTVHEFTSFLSNVKLHYGFGVSLGVLASILVLLFTINRMFPQVCKKQIYLIEIAWMFFLINIVRIWK